MAYTYLVSVEEFLASLIIGAVGIATMFWTSTVWEQTMKSYASTQTTGWQNTKLQTAVSYSAMTGSEDTCCPLSLWSSQCWYRNIILPVVLYRCETWSLTLREERRLRVFENRVLRRVFGPKRDEVTEEWRKLHNEELRDLYSLTNIVWVVKSRRMRWAGHVARVGEGRGVHRVLRGETWGKEIIEETQT